MFVLKQLLLRRPKGDDERQTRRGFTRRKRSRGHKQRSDFTFLRPETGQLSNQGTQRNQVQEQEREVGKQHLQNFMGHSELLFYWGGGAFAGLRPCDEICIRWHPLR